MPASVAQILQIKALKGHWLSVPVRQTDRNEVFVRSALAPDLRDRRRSEERFAFEGSPGRFLVPRSRDASARAERPADRDDKRRGRPRQARTVLRFKFAAVLGAVFANNRANSRAVGRSSSTFELLGL